MRVKKILLLGALICSSCLGSYIYKSYLTRPDLTIVGGVEMRDAFQRIADELGTQYTLAYDPSDEKMDGKWRSIELKVRRPNLNIRTRRGYFAVKR